MLQEYHPSVDLHCCIFTFEISSLITPSKTKDFLINMPPPSTMKAVVVESTGGIDALKYKDDHPTPALTPGHALIKNEYAGLNFIDTYHRSGLYPRQCPFILGQEGGGIIIELSASSESNHGLKVGDRVVYGAFGSYAEYTSVPLDKVVPIPDSLNMQTAVSCMTQGLTAHYLSSSVGEGLTTRGDWVLVYGVGSGTGQWTAQMLKLRGYRVIGTTSCIKVTDNYNNNVQEAAEAFGCEHLIVLENAPGKSYAAYTSVDIVSKVMEVTNGNGCKMIIDGVGKDTYEMSLKCLSKRGLFVSFGNASGAVPAFPVLRLLPQSAYMTRPKLNDYVATRSELLDRANEVFGWVSTGRLNIVVDKVFELEDVAKGHEYLEEGKSKGKILFKL